MAIDATGTPTTTHSIPKINTAVDAPSGKGANAQMDTLDSLLNSRTAVQVAGTHILKNKLLTADANPAYQVNGDGKLQWGAGGASALDANLYREYAGTLKTDGRLDVGTYLGANGGSGANSVIIGYSGGGAAPGISFGAANDTNLYRSAANLLKTDDEFHSNSQIAANVGQTGQTVIGDDGAGKPAIRFGNAMDTNLYRSAANELTTDDAFVTGAGFTSLGQGRVTFNVAGTQLDITRPITTGYGDMGGITLSSLNGSSVNKTLAWIYAHADDMTAGAEVGHLILKTMNSGTLTQGLKLDSAQKLWIGSTEDTNLYRSAADTLKTDDSLHVGIQIRARAGQAGQIDLGDDNTVARMTFGSAGDTNLYRSAANTLKTDDSLEVAGSLTLGTNLAVAEMGSGTPAAGKYLDGAGTWTTLPTSSGPTITYSVAPPGSPVTGDIWYHTDVLNTSTYSWAFRYNSSSTNTDKWEYIGGIPLQARVETEESHASSSYAALATAGPSVAVPRAGVYLVEHGFEHGGTGGAWECFMSYDIGGTGAVDADSTAAPASEQAGVMTSKQKTLTAVTLTAKYRSGSASSTSYRKRWIRITPIRVS